jgi:hypothetical protein
MPLYRFHLEGEDPDLDVTQANLPDDDAACRAAIMLAAGMMRDGEVDLLGDRSLRVTISVSDGRLVANLDVLLAFGSECAVSK